MNGIAKDGLSSTAPPAVRRKAGVHLATLHVVRAPIRSLASEGRGMTAAFVFAGAALRSV